MVNDLAKIHRYTDYAWPAYKYVPAFGIHPNKNSSKHIPDLPDANNSFSASNWNHSQRYLYAIDLFNRLYYWEVHEVLEKLWMETGKDSDEGIFLKGLIQIAIALLKKIEGNNNGLVRLTKKAIPRIYSQSDVYLGLDVNDLIKKHKLFIDGEIQTPPVISLQFP